jgi:methionyl aminopeptidase
MHGVFVILLFNQDTASGVYDPFPAYPYTGSVRPVYPLSPRRPVPKTIKHPDWAVTGIPKREMRLSRSKWDLLDAKGQEAMRKVCKLAREVLDITAAAMKPGVTTDYLDEICHNACVEREVSNFHSRANISRCSLTRLAVISFPT